MSRSRAPVQRSTPAKYLSAMPPDRHVIELYRCRLYQALLVFAVAGMLFSPPALSVSLIGLVGVGLLDPRLIINPRWRERIGRTIRQPVALGLLLLYLLLLAGCWQTLDWPYYLERLRVKLPLLALPIAWAGLPKLTKTEEGRVWGGITLLLTLTLLGVLTNYALHFSEVNEAVRRGGSVPVPRNHVRFSLLIAVGVFAALRAVELRAWQQRRAWWVAAAILFVGLHLLAVRSGLVGAYAGVAVYGILLAARLRRWGLAVGVIIGLGLLPVLGYLSVPSLRAKVQYMRYELLHRDRALDRNDYSDDGRLTSIRLGWQVYDDNPWVGVGPGNLRAEMDRRYAEARPGAEGKRPHNQFVSALAGSGMLGGVMTLAAFYLLWLGGWRMRSPAYLAIWSVFFLSCLVENTLENTVGVSAFSLLLLFSGLRTPSDTEGGDDLTPSP